MTSVNSTCYVDSKKSGIEWYGEAPSNWNVTRNKDIFRERGSLSHSGNETLLTVSHITGVTKRSEKKVNMFMAETMEGYKLCKKGDMIINTMWAWMGALGTSPHEGICSPAYGVYAPQKNIPYNPNYFDYLYRIPKAISEMTRNSKGIVSSRLRLYPKDFLQIKTALPSYKEQSAIADYLDTFTKNIDMEIDLLYKKNTHYGKLKQSLINECMTYGLDRAAEMVGSGDEWLPEIPMDWTIMRLKDVAKMATGNSLNDELKQIYSEETPESTPYVSTKDIDLTTCFLNIYNGVYIPKSERHYRKAPRHSTLLCIEGGSAGKKTAYVKNDVCYVNKLLCITNNDNVDSLYLHYFIRTALFSSQFNTCLTGLKDNFWGVTGPQVSRLKLLVPPMIQQQKIATYIDNKIEKIDCVVKGINTKIVKLRELRESIISETTTGQIKVKIEEIHS
jgi:type I restriction enzyme S subunit